MTDFQEKNLITDIKHCGESFQVALLLQRKGKVIKVKVIHFNYKVVIRTRVLEENARTKESKVDLDDFQHSNKFTKECFTKDEI